jgi:RNA polymerase sigma-70 factor (ECF subfamily)
MTEETAVRLCQQGDPAGLATLVALHQRRAIRVAALITRDPHLAEDVVAEAFLTAFRHIRGFDAQRPFAPWFHRVVTNVALKTLAARQREVPLECPQGSGPSLSRPAVMPASVMDDPLAWLAQVEDRELIQGALRTLPPKQRAAIVLRYYADLDEAAIAQTLGIPRGTVKSRLAIALARLRQVLARP